MAWEVRRRSILQQELENSGIARCSEMQGGSAPMVGSRITTVDVRAPRDEPPNLRKVPTLNGSAQEAPQVAVHAVYAAPESINIGFLSSSCGNGSS